MKKYFSLCILFVLCVAPFHFVSASEMKKLEPVNCFDFYKFGSVVVNVDPIVRTIQPGGVVQFKGQIINNNAYPIVDGSVYVKIFREESQNRVNALPLVDQFVAKE